MLEQNTTPPNGPQRDGAQPNANPIAGMKPFDMSRSFDGAPKFIPVRASQLPAPASPVSPPRGSTAVPLPASPSQATAQRLSDLVQRAEAALPKLESRLGEYYGTTERGVQLTADIEERLKLGVRMLQAFDVQSARGESMASRAVAAIEEFERVVAGTIGDSQVSLRAEVDRIVAEKLEEIARGLDAQRERFRQFETGAEHLAQEKLGRVQSELEAQLGRLKRADIDAAQLADERIAAIRGLCDAQVDRLSRASEESLAATGAAGERVFAATEAHIERLAKAQQEVEVRESNLLGSFESELASRLEAVLRRHDEAAAEMEARVGRVTAEVESRAQRLAEQSIGRLESELTWRIERVKEVEARIEHAANAALAAVDAEFGQRHAHLDSTLSRADQLAKRADEARERISDASVMIERSERATAARAGLSAESLRLIESLAARVGDATALREMLGKLIHELAAAREVVHGDMRRMRDELGWLVQKSERLTGELVERADAAQTTGESIRAITDAARPVLADLTRWGPILEDPSQDRIRPLTTAITTGVRDELSSDMHGFAAALRQLATRADSTFHAVSIETDLLRDSTPAAARAHDEPHRDLAQAFARELAELAPASSFSSDPRNALRAVHPSSGLAPVPPSLTANRPIDLEA